MPTRTQCPICGNIRPPTMTLCRECTPKVARGSICSQCGMIVRPAHGSPTLCDLCKSDGASVKITNWIAEAGYLVTQAPCITPARADEIEELNHSQHYNKYKQMKPCPCGCGKMVLARSNGCRASAKLAYHARRRAKQKCAKNLS